MYSLAKALKRIKSYCDKHYRCKERRFNNSDDMCVIQVPPCDWDAAIEAAQKLVNKQGGNEND